VAVKMMFYPVHFVGLKPFLGWQGIVPANAENLAASSPLRAFDEWSTGLSLSWELDVWGRFRRSIASADADLQASVGDYDAILLSLITEVATAYTDYRTFQQRLGYARSNVDIQNGACQPI
jgi:outer membrane protein TolC